jgi:hypothetical protein
MGGLQRQQVHDPPQIAPGGLAVVGGPQLDSSVGKLMDALAARSLPSQRRGISGGAWDAGRAATVGGVMWTRWARS